MERPFAFSPNAPILAGANVKAGRHRRVVLYNFETGKRVLLQGTVSEPLGRPAFSPDGKLVAVPMHLDIKVFRTDTGRRVARLRPGGIMQFATFHPNGRLLAVARGPETQLWSVHDWHLALTLLSVSLRPQIDHGISWWLAYTPEGYYTGSEGVEKRIRWRIGSHYFPGEKFMTRFRRQDKIRRILN